MKKHLRNSLGLMTVSVAGISLFMAVWIWGSFIDEQRSLSETSTHTLFDAVQAYTQHLLKKREINIPIESFRQARDSGIFMYGRRKGFEFINRPSYGRTLAPVLFPEPMEKWVSVKHLKTVVGALLHEQKIGLDFTLDTVRISEEKWMEDRPPHRDNGPHWPGFYREQESSLLPGGAVSSRPLPFNTEKQLFMRLTLHKPFWYILSALKWQIMTVTVLISLTVGCFTYMIYLLFRQKKLADIKNDFINNMTHELKTPIATVSAAVEALTGFGALEDPKKAELYLKISLRELDHLSGLIEKVMDIAVYEHEYLVLTCRPTQTADLLQNAVERYRQITDRPVSISLHCTPGMPSIPFDALHMKNAISNLIDNAIKYSGDPVEVRIDSTIHASRLEISVSDNGIGIEPKYQPHIFERFFRVPTGNIHKIKGYGLGLAYVKQVVTLHGGEVSVISQPSKGSTFKISIPINRS
ncbi:His Kinase A (phospho-acceptor) domain-containing protein [bacterium A37T11]|nr:His Kinase A (phospho-acceptor) domain-containing protein [bacterium A37T11]